MIIYTKGNIFDSPAQTLANPVNTVGVMGKGLALQFKQRYPEMFQEYKEACDMGEMHTGHLLIWRGQDHWVLNFPTKKNWRDPSKYDYIDYGLFVFTLTYEEEGITSVAFPKLGCGCGGLDWEFIKPVMEDYLKDLPIATYIYE